MRRHPANPPGPEGSKGKQALAGARGVLTCSGGGEVGLLRPPACTARGSDATAWDMGVLSCFLTSETFGCPRSGHQLRAGTASRVRTAEFQGSPPGPSTAEGLMSAVWTPGRVRDRVRGVLVADPDVSGPACSSWLLCWSSRGALVQRRLRPEPLLGRLTARGRGALATGCAYCTSPRTSGSTPDPHPVAPDPCAVLLRIRSRRRRPPPGGRWPGPGRSRARRQCVE